MFKTLLFVAILTSLLATDSLKAQSIISENGYPEHFIAGTVIGGTVSYFTFKKTHNKWKGIAAGLLASSGAGLLKELADPVIFNGTRNWKDFGYTALGGMVGVSVIIPLRGGRPSTADRR